jgi:hypothetical protein
MQGDEGGNFGKIARTVWWHVQGESVVVGRKECSGRERDGNADQNMHIKMPALREEGDHVSVNKK